MKNTSALVQDFWNNKKQFRLENLYGRYVTYDHIDPVLQELKEKFGNEEVGKSTCGTPIPLLKFGNGKVKILAWSQMHGNESTTTKAILDICNAFKKFPDHPSVQLLEEKIELRIIPILNPDGARAYTRVNYNDVDLNRDAQDLTQEESKVLRNVFDEFKPHYCLNLHDQRTIFSAGEGPKPATLSFLTPAMNEERSVTPAREESMKVIVGINKLVQELIPGQVGRYSDAYNINCTGDTFQTLQVPTILFEAGHYPEDYQREKTREFVAYALLTAMTAIATGEARFCDHEQYFQIPENQKLFFDVVLRKALVEEEIVDVAIQFKEELKGEKIVFNPIVEKIGADLPFYGHKEVECEGKELIHPEKAALAENDVVAKLLLKNELLIINYANN